MNIHKPQLPVLTATNFFEWKFKMNAVLDGLGMLKMLKGEKARDPTGKFIPEDPELKTAAMALIAPLIHGSLISTVTANGGDTDPVKLWSNIMAFGLSKKESNIFRANRNFNLIEIDPNNLSSTILKYRDAIAELKSLDDDINDRQLAHTILSKIPPSLGTIRDSIISTGQSSAIVTSDIVLDMLDNKEKTLLPVSISQSTSKADHHESDAASALLTFKCRDGRHNPSESHSAEQCFALHPNLLDEYRARLKLRKLKTYPETNLTTAASCANFIIQPASVSSATSSPDNVSEGHESDVSLL